jgi:co-chaperonin GroES (HSP10)
MKLDIDSFSIGMVKIEHKKILVRTDQAETTKGKNVVISDDLRNRMIKTHIPEIGVWKENVQRKPARRVKLTSALLIEKYQWQLEEERRYRVTQKQILFVGDAVW